LDAIDRHAIGAYHEFTAMDEFRNYLEMLLGHICNSARGDCPECRSLERIYQFMQAEIFSTVIYTETVFDARKAAALASKPVNRAAAGPRRSTTL
jgi:hypothetical protein